MEVKHYPFYGKLPKQALESLNKFIKTMQITKENIITIDFGYDGNIQQYRYSLIYWSKIVN